MGNVQSGLFAPEPGHDRNPSRPVKCREVGHGFHPVIEWAYIRDAELQDLLRRLRPLGQQVHIINLTVEPRELLERDARRPCEEQIGTEGAAYFQSHDESRTSGLGIGMDTTGLTPHEVAAKIMGHLGHSDRWDDRVGGRARAAVGERIDSVAFTCADDAEVDRGGAAARLAVGQGMAGDRISVFVLNLNFDLAGADPLLAVKYQIVVMFMIAAATSMGCIFVALLVYRRLFNSRHQLRAERIVGK